tara:strand:+ start:534 stop:1376 length:843 start_codon:yes stop_codon:yes gene_type:complete
MNILELLNSGSKELNLNGIKTHMLDSEILLSKILNKSRAKILLEPEQEVKLTDTIKFKELIRRRSLKEPVAYILNEKEFWSRNFYVNKNALIPRPETELMVDKLTKIFRGKAINILDIGTGSGCILLSLLIELKNSYGQGIDISKNAIKVARYNAKKYNLINRAKFLKTCFSNINHKKFDLVVSNPPYIRRSAIKNLDGCIKLFEPKVALDGGNDGLDLIRKVIYKAKYILKIKGLLALEIGNEQLKEVSKILKRNNLRVEHIVNDYKDNARCIISKMIL